METNIDRIMGELTRLQDELAAGWAKIEAEAEDMRAEADDRVRAIMVMLEKGDIDG